MEIIQQRVAAFLYEPGHFSKKNQSNNNKKRKRENDSNNEEDETTDDGSSSNNNINRLRGMIDFSGEDSDSDNHPEDEQAADASMIRHGPLPPNIVFPPPPRAQQQNANGARSAMAQFRSRSSRGVIDAEAPVPQQNTNAARPAAEPLRRRSNVAQQQNANATRRPVQRSRSNAQAASAPPPVPRPQQGNTNAARPAAAQIHLSFPRRGVLQSLGRPSETGLPGRGRQVSSGRGRVEPGASLRQNGQQQSSAGNVRVPQGRRQAEDASNDAGNNERPYILDFFESSEDEN